MQLGETREVGFRKARVDHNNIADVTKAGEFAVFMQTFYLGRWYYDGYRACPTEADAVAFATKWLNGENP